MTRRVCRGFVLFFAVWTLLCNVVVFVGGNLFVLLGLSVAVLLVIISILVFLKYNKSKPGREIQDDATGDPEDSLDKCQLAWSRKALVAGIVSLAIVLFYFFTGNLLLFLVFSVVYLISVLGVIFCESFRVAEVGESRYWGICLWGLAAISALVVLFGLQMNWDDCFYLNAAVSVTDDPSHPIMRDDGLHGVEGVGFNPIYRLQSLTVLAGTAGFLTGIPAIYFLNLIFPLLAAILVPLALSELFRHIFPGNWVWLTAATVFLLIFMGGGVEPFSDLGFYHLHQGKAVLLTIIMPLSMAYSFRFAKSQSLKNWLLLAAAQVAGLGMNPTAIFLLPPVSLIALLSYWRPSRKLTAVILIGLLASAYLPIAGLAIKSETEERLEHHYRFPSTDTAEEFLYDSNIELVEDTLEYMLGRGTHRYFALFCLLFAWSVARTTPGRKLLAALPLGLLIVLFNPLLNNYIARYITSYSTYWRVLWLVPVPAYVAVFLVSPFLNRRFESVWLRRGYWLVVSVILVVLFVYAMPVNKTANNLLELDPGLRTDEPYYSVAASLNESTPGRACVVAPEEVSVWIPALHLHDYPLVARRLYLTMLFPVISVEDFEHRLFMVDYISYGHNDCVTEFLANAAAQNRFSRGLERYQITGICLNARAPWVENIRSALNSKGFSEVRRIKCYEIWVR